MDIYSGEEVYRDDRAVRITGNGNHRACGAERGRPYKTVEGSTFENDLNLLQIVLTLTGLRAPRDGVVERVWMDVFILIGTPEEIVETASVIKARLG